MEKNIIIGKAWASFERDTEAHVKTGEQIAEAASVQLSACKDGAAWESLTATWAADYAKARKVTPSAASVAVSRLVAKVRGMFDVKKPQSEKAVKAAAERLTTEADNIKAALISGVGDAKAQDTLSKWARGEDATRKALAASILNATAAERAKRAAARQQEAEAEILNRAIGTVAKHFDLTAEMLVEALTAAQRKATSRKAA